MNTTNPHVPPLSANPAGETQKGPETATHSQLQLAPKGVTALQNESGDSLQGCMQYFINYYRLNTTLTSLLNGLPLKSERLTPQLFTRAAARAGLASRVIRRAAPLINPHTLPAVVMLKTGRAAILKAYKPAEAAPDAAVTRTDAAHHATYLVKDTFSGEEKTYTGPEFEAIYGGFMILVRLSVIGEMGHESRNPAKQWFWGTLWQFWPLYRRVMMAAFIINTIAMVTPLFSMNVYDRVVPNAAYETLWVLAIGVFIAYVFDYIFKQLRVYFVDTAGRSADILLSSRIYNQVLNVRLGTQQSSAGMFANQLKDYDSLREFFASSTMVALVDVPFMFLFFAVIWMISGPLALIPMLAVPIVLSVSWLVQRPIRQLVVQNAHESDLKHGHLVETINGLENIKSLGTQSQHQGQWERVTGLLATQNNKIRFISNLSANFTGFIQSLVNVGLIVAGVYFIHAGNLTMGGLIATTMLSSRALAPLGQLAGLFSRWQQSIVSLEALTKLMQSPMERPDGKSFVHVSQLAGHIRFENVDFKYPGSQMDSLKNLNLTINPGEKVALVGRAGSGKSSLSRLILNLYAPQKGAIYMDNLDSRQLDPAELRKNISYFPQNLYLFRGTLRDNLLMAHPAATDDELLQAVEISGAMRLIRRHPLGFDLPVGERGEMLSGGQRQAVGLARALMQPGNIVILDDPTSEMDIRSEEWVKNRLSTWLKNRTLVLITHRPAMLELVDRLIVLDEGRIIVDGPKDKVLEFLRNGSRTNPGHPSVQASVSNSGNPS